VPRAWENPQLMRGVFRTAARRALTQAVPIAKTRRFLVRRAARSTD
jgi:hypothetical protein